MSDFTSIKDAVNRDTVIGRFVSRLIVAGLIIDGLQLAKKP
jgi:hypothetical protein